MTINFSLMKTKEQFQLEDKLELIKSIATRRYVEEVRGIEVEGVFFNTERDSQALLTGAALQALIDPNYVCRWKTTAGFVDLTSEQLLSISQTMRKHVQDCFNREAEIVEAIEDGTYTSDMKEQGWP